MPNTNATRKISGAGFGASIIAEKNRRSVREHDELFFTPFSITERAWRTLTVSVKAIAGSLVETCSCRGQLLLLLRHCRPRHGRTRV